jgi:Zn-dependent protease with chaperone function
MLAALEPDERRALLAHEQAHLRHRHDRYLLIGKLAAGLPVLTPLAAQQRHALERWADEDAAEIVGDRSLVARAVARAALAAHDRPVPALAMLGADVPARVEALLRVPSGSAPGAVWSLVAFAAVGITLVSAAVQVHHLSAVLTAICPV